MKMCGVGHFFHQRVLSTWPTSRELLEELPFREYESGKSKTSWPKSPLVV